VSDLGSSALNTDTVGPILRERIPHEQESMRARDLPNLISLLRILLVLPLVVLVLHRENGYALVLFGVAGVSDAVDGYLAKRFDWSSWIGGILDPIADKLLIVATFVALGVVGSLPLWLVFIVLLRDIVIVVGAAAYLFFIDRFSAEPTLISKANTVAQLSLVFAVLVDGAFGILPQGVEGGLITIVAVTTVASGVGYVFTWGSRARARTGHHHAP